MGKVDAGHGRHRPGQPTSTQDEGSAMTEGSAPLYRPSEEGEVAVGRIGLILFAAILMIMGGVFQAFTGLVAIFNDQFLIPTREYLFQFDRTSWGWIHLVLGVGHRRGGCRPTGRPDLGPGGRDALALCSAVVMFAFLPQYPLWALIVIALSVAVIWAVATADR
jgi:hypothetical protein